MRSLTLCGRGDELKFLADRWRLCSDLANPQPQLVNIKAETGFGKTRLAIEFYRWLQEQQGQVSGNYWPKLQPSRAGKLAINPILEDCDLRSPIPFFWWGLRAEDYRSDVIASHDRFAVAHLVAMLAKKARSLSRTKKLTEIWGSFGVDVAAGATQFGTLVSAGKAVFETAKLYSGETADAVREKAMDHSPSRAKLLLADVAVQSVRSVERGRFWLGLVCGEDGVIQEAFPIG